MQSFNEFLILPGSYRDDFGGTDLDAIPSDFPVTVSVHLRRKAELTPAADRKRFLSRAELADKHGASMEDVKVVFEFAQHFEQSTGHSYWKCCTHFSGFPGKFNAQQA